MAEVDFIVEAEAMVEVEVGVDLQSRDNQIIRKVQFNAITAKIWSQRSRLLDKAKR